MMLAIYMPSRPGWMRFRDSSYKRMQSDRCLASSVKVSLSLNWSRFEIGASAPTGPPMKAPPLPATGTVQRWLSWSIAA